MFSGAHLLSRAVAGTVSSAVRGLTIVFGMWTGMSPGRVDTRNPVLGSPRTQQWKTPYSTP